MHFGIDSQGTQLIASLMYPLAVKGETAAPTALAPVSRLPRDQAPLLASSMEFR